MYTPFSHNIDGWLKKTLVTNYIPTTILDCGHPWLTHGHRDQKPACLAIPAMTEWHKNNQCTTVRNARQAKSPRLLYWPPNYLERSLIEHQTSKSHPRRPIPKPTQHPKYSLTSICLYSTFVLSTITKLLALILYYKIIRNQCLLKLQTESEILNVIRGRIINI